MDISLGIGLTNRCNCTCKHCYSKLEPKHDLDFNDIVRFCDKFSIKSVNFGTGESYLYPNFLDVINYFNKKNIPMSLTTNGYSIKMLSDIDILKFNDIDFSLDFPIKDLHDNWRTEGCYDSVLEGIDRCKKLNVECSITMCLMNTNYNYLLPMLYLCRDLDVNLRINIYKPVYTNEYSLSCDQFWESMNLLIENSELISCSEPILKAAFNIDSNILGSPCAHKSLRIKPNGSIVPCVYFNNSSISIKDDFIYDLSSENELLNNLNCMLDDNIISPTKCVECRYYVHCNGGCKSRRILTNPLAEDQYCFIDKNLDFPIVNWCNESKNLVHSDYLCTMIVK